MNRPSSLPFCRAKLCSLPSVLNAHTISSRQRGSYTHGETVHWACQSDYWVSIGVTEFNSTCANGSFSQPLKHCIEKPQCNALTAPQNGQVNSSSVAHVGDAVLYQCTPRHSLHGPNIKICSLDERNNLTYWSPPEKTSCSAEEYLCPSLLPQPHGNYSHYREHFHLEDTVVLICNNGYYIRDNSTSPERVQLRCRGMDWSPSQKHCQIIIQTNVTQELIESVTASVRYAVPSLRNNSLQLDGLLSSLACQDVIKEYTHYNAQETAAFHPTIQCYRRLAIRSGPSKYEGILEVSTAKGIEKVCIKESADAEIACNALGYHGYTTRIYDSAVAITTNLEVVDNSILRWNTMPCNIRITCRPSCEELHVDHGRSCRKSFENEQCHVKCDPGYYLIGASTLVCNGQGQWAGSTPRCDGKF